jgi:hypothetical protein
MVNNAGFGLVGEFHKLEWTKQRSMLMVNVIALTHMTHLFINSIIKHKDEHRILNTSSMVSIEPVPLFAAYSSSKAFVRFLTCALSTELEKYNITTTALIPGTTRTPFLEKSSYDRTTGFFLMSVATPSYVAQFGYYHCMMGNKLAVPNLINLFIRGLLYVTPLEINNRLFYYFNKSS